GGGEELVPALQGQEKGVSVAAIPPDAKFVVSGGFDRTVRLWTVATHLEKAKLVDGVEPRSVAFSGDGKWLAAGLFDGSVKIWDSAKLQGRSISAHNVQVIGLGFSPDSTLLA